MEWILSRKPGKLCEDARRAHSPLAESGGALSDVTRFFGDLHLAATLRFAQGASIRFLISPIHDCIPSGERENVLIFLLRSGSMPFAKGEGLTFLCLKEKLQKKQTSVPLDRRCGVDFVTKAR